MTPPKGRPRSPGRTGGRWRRVRDKCKAAAARGVPCGWCGGVVDTTLAYPHPHSLAVDHVISLIEGGLPYEVQPMHKTCNEAKEVARRKSVRQAALNTSRAW